VIVILYGGEVPSPLLPRHDWKRVASSAHTIWSSHPDLIESIEALCTTMEKVRRMLLPLVTGTTQTSERQPIWPKYL
jgi:hypothetical protein